MGPVLLFDIDGTLTAPRKDLEPKMATVLSELSIPFHVAAGSDKKLLDHQFFEPLWQYGYRGSFEAFISNGADHYRCSFEHGVDVRLIDAFDFATHVGQAAYDGLVALLTDALESDAFRLPASIPVVGDRVINRGPMINLAPAGRPSGRLSEDARASREAFVAFDTERGYREQLLEHLRREVGAREIPDLVVMLGGQTSFDIVIAGKDKGGAALSLVERGISPVVFVGDALFPGGNDAPILDVIEQWSDGPCPVEAIRVDGFEDTIELLRSRGWIAG